MTKKQLRELDRQLNVKFFAALDEAEQKNQVVKCLEATKKQQILDRIDAIIEKAKRAKACKLKLPSGKFWLAIWGFVALVRFALGLPIDPIFLGVLGIYSGSKWIKGKTDEKEIAESE